MTHTAQDPLLDSLAAIERTLDDPLYRDNPLRSVVVQLIDSLRTLEHRLDKIGAISDCYQAQLKATSERLEEAAHTDLLTGLSNRRDILERLQGELTRSQRTRKRFSVLIADIDHFKVVNDTHGHLVGDRVLADVADRLRMSLRASDVCARWGGEEFLVLLPNTDLPRAAILAERLRQSINVHPFTGHGYSLALTISLGGTTWQGEHDLDSLMQRADTMLYEAKVQGRDRVQLTPGAGEPPADLC
jgi:diguanylate cyclase (GGDEF)-like protein